MKLKNLSLVFMVVALCVLVAGCGTKTTTSTNQKEKTNAVTNTVEKTTVTTDKTSYKIGENIKVTYKIIEPLKTGAWLGIVPSTTKHGLETDGDAADIDYEYLDGSTSGSFTFPAPSAAGSYDFRIYDTENEGGIELGTVSFTIIE